MKKNRIFGEVRSLLSKKLPADQVQKLCDEGFELKSPTRRSALAVALYKKAEKGDLSAIKEMLAMLETQEAEEKAEPVVIIDDIT